VLEVVVRFVEGSCLLSPAIRCISRVVSFQVVVCSVVHLQSASNPPISLNIQQRVSSEMDHDFFPGPPSIIPQYPTSTSSMSAISTPPSVPMLGCHVFLLCALACQAHSSLFPLCLCRMPLSFLVLLVHFVHLFPCAICAFCASYHFVFICFLSFCFLLLLVYPVFLFPSASCASCPFLLCFPSPNLVSFLPSCPGCIPGPRALPPSTF